MFKPTIIQGGMGLGVSTWQMAQAIATQNTADRKVLAVPSGVALERLLAGKLKEGGSEADEIVRVIRNCPHKAIKAIGERIIEKYHHRPSSLVPVFTLTPSEFLIGLRICADYVFVTLAKENHNCPVGINYLEKIAFPHLCAIYGAMLASVDFILMGAGIPDQIPAVIDAYLEGQPATYKIPVIGDKERYPMTFNPGEFLGENLIPIHRPYFLPIISSNTLAKALNKQLKSKIDGFVVEEWTAGGHNAPPRNKVSYCERDFVDYAELAKLGFPFWLAGSYASPEKLKQAQSVGAVGIQVGSILALCEQSGLDPALRSEARKLAFNNKLRIRTAPLISPTGFPFKVAEVEGTISDPTIYEARTRICDQGSLLRAYRTSTGSIGYRCASEPVEDYLRKEGRVEDTVGRGCICDILIKAIGLKHMCRPNDPAGLTLGDDTSFVHKLMKHEGDSYSVKQVFDYLFSNPA